MRFGHVPSGTLVGCVWMSPILLGREWWLFRNAQQFIQTHEGCDFGGWIEDGEEFPRGTIEWMGQHNCIFIGRCFPIWIRFPPPVILYVFRERASLPTNQDQKVLRCTNVAFVTVYPDHTWGWWRGGRSRSRRSSMQWPVAVTDCGLVDGGWELYTVQCL